MKFNINRFPGILILTIFIFAACGTNRAEKEKIRYRTDPMAERMLKTLDQKKYTEFSSDFDDSLKTYFSEVKFNDLHSFMKKSQGEYVSKSFFSIIKDKNTLTIQYFVVYTIKTPTYVLILTFNSPDGTGPVSGFKLLPFNVSR